jgi:hypothetical protein
VSHECFAVYGALTCERREKEVAPAPLPNSTAKPATYAASRVVALVRLKRSGSASFSSVVAGGGGATEEKDAGPRQAGSRGPC